MRLPTSAAAPLLAIVLLAPAAALRAQPGSPDVRRAAATIRAEDVRAHVDFLAGDSLRGRATPSPGLEAAAEYIAARFRAWGLRPAGDSRTFVQRFPLRANVVPDVERRLVLHAGGRETRWAYGRDYFAFAARGVATDARPVFFAGPVRGAGPLPEAVRGAVVVYDWPGSPIEELGLVIPAVTAVFEAGAAGMVLVHDAGVAADSIGWFATQMEASNQTLPFPMAGLREAPAWEMFRAAGLDLDSLRRRPAGSGVVALPGVRLEMNGLARTVISRAPNVIGIIPGSDPRLRDTYVVVTAHFDHVGVGHPDARGDSIFNGADDNASGTAALLEAAEAFASLRARPARSILFLAVSGEEMGLQGSVQWVEHPTVPLDRVVANVNLDMVGRNSPDTLIVMGQEYSSLGALTTRVGAAHPEIGFALPTRMGDPKLGWFSRSDHVAFVRAGIPALFLTSMPHPDYHRATDDPSRLDMDKVTRVARTLFHLVHIIASDPEKPLWTATGLEEAREAVR
jgi:hypothetical protein